MQDGRPHTESQLLCHDCRFHVHLGSFELHVTDIRGTWLCCKVHLPNKGCVIRDKTMHITDEYALNSEVCLIRWL